MATVLFELDEEAFVAEAIPRPPWPRRRPLSYPWNSDDWPLGSLPDDPPWPAQTVPTRFRVGSVELFGWVRPDGLHLPFHPRVDVLYTARFGLECLRQTWERGPTEFTASRDNGPVLWMVRDGDHIVLQETDDGDAVRVPYGILQAAWRQFATRVRWLLKRLTPAFADPAAPRWSSPVMRSGGGPAAAAAWRAWLAGDDVPNDSPVNFHAFWLQAAAWQQAAGDPERMPSTAEQQQQASEALAARLIARAVDAT